ncbi:hypothetical protein KEJ33_05830 [Candidatus Bathyarchaeota archaeon]|nr:hypothetical protein [Candidatus Bathyarchaeota archaeon]
MRKMKIEATLMLTVLALLTVGEAAANGKAPNTPYPFFLEGNRIDFSKALREGYNYLRLPADEPCFVSHGWMFAGDFPHAYLPEFAKDIGTEFTTASMVLYIDGEKVELRKWRHFYQVWVQNGVVLERAFLTAFYVQFDAGYFEKGRTYEFKREMWKEGTIWLTQTLYVEFY